MCRRGTVIVLDRTGCGGGHEYGRKCLPQRVAGCGLLRLSGDREPVRGGQWK